MTPLNPEEKKRIEATLNHQVCKLFTESIVLQQIASEILFHTVAFHKATPEEARSTYVAALANALRHNADELEAACVHIDNVPTEISKLVEEICKKFEQGQ